MIRPATPDDFDFLHECCKLFFVESGYSNMTWDEDKARETTAILCSEQVHCLISDNAGFVAWTHERYWTTEEVAHLFLFYVKPQFRNGKHSKPMLDAMEKIIVDCNIKKCYASSTGGFDDDGINEKTFSKLFSRIGYKTAGSLLIKEYHNG